MTVGKLLIGLTLVLVSALLFGGLYHPDTFVMTLADTSTTYAVLRGGIIVMLISLLITHPPRSRELRAVVGVASGLLASLSVYSLFSYQVALLDAVVFMEVALIFAVEALETRRTIPVNKKHSPARKIPVLST